MCKTGEFLDLCILEEESLFSMGKKTKSRKKNSYKLALPMTDLHSLICGVNCSLSPLPLL